MMREYVAYWRSCKAIQLAQEAEPEEWAKVTAAFARNDAEQGWKLHDELMLKYLPSVPEER
jgi:hypothetical protein